MAADDEVTLGEVVRRLDSIVVEMRNLASSFVRTELYEAQRGESGRRMGDMEKSVSDLRADHARDIADVRNERNADKLEADRRFRTSVNLFIAGGISIVGGAFLLVLQLVAK